MSWDARSFDPESFDPRSWGLTWEGGLDIASKYGGGSFEEPKHKRKPVFYHMPDVEPEVRERQRADDEKASTPVLSPAILFGGSPDEPARASMLKSIADAEAAAAEELEVLMLLMEM